MTDKETALAVIAKLEATKEVNPYTDLRIPLQDRQCAMLGRMGGLDEAIISIKLAFSLPLTLSELTNEQ